MKFKKILILGSPGSGKSTLACQISNLLKIEVYSLDKFYWLPFWQKKNKLEFRNDILIIIDKGSWIIDGNYLSADVSRFDSADLVIFLDVSPVRCVVRILRRFFFHFRKEAEHLPLGCYEQFDVALLHYAATFRTRQRSHILKSVSVRQADGALVILKNNKDILKLISELQLCV